MRIMCARAFDMELKHYCGKRCASGDWLTEKEVAESAHTRNERAEKQKPSEKKQHVRGERIN